MKKGFPFPAAFAALALILISGCVRDVPEKAAPSSAAGVSSAQAESVYGASVVKDGKYNPLEVLCTVPNESGCTNLGSMCIDGGALFCIKTPKDNSSAELFRIDSFAAAARKFSSWNHTGLYHANGLTSLGGSLYCATMQAPEAPRDDAAQIWKISESGEKREAYRAEKDTIYSITRFSGTDFIVGLNGSATYGQYAVALLSNGKIQLSRRFSVNQMQAYGTGQDISYFDGCLYIPTWDGSTGNKILKVNLGQSVTEGKQYEPDEVIEVDTNDASITKLEVESMDADANGRLVVCTNFETETNKNTDTIFRFPE